ncbi:MAG TPA: hypothetical protein PKD83_02990 [Ignavibacteria bacterium]|nr:hypothetical protein [Ignavibacteria bacterium]
MKISIKDGSNYFKGLLLLISKDRKIKDPEIQLMKHIGKALGFEREFCENAIHEILENKFIIDDTPKFSTKELAVMFIKDGLAIANSDTEIHLAEEEWLRSAAEHNGLDLNWFQLEKKFAENRHHLPSKMEVDSLIVEY